MDRSFSPLPLLVERSGNSGPPLFFLHGLFASARIWFSVGKKLEDRFRIRRVDLRNHGSSPHHPVHSVPAMAEDLIPLLEKEESPSFLVGHSMGGLVSMYIALTRPDLISGIYVIDVAPMAYEDTHEDVYRLFHLDLSRFATRAEIDLEAKKIIPDRILRAFLLTNLHRTDSGFQWKLNVPALEKSNYLEGSRWPEAVYEGPSFFLMGEDSYYSGEHAFQAIRKHFPRGEIHVEEKAGHWIHSTHQDLFLETLSNFIEGNRY